MKRHAGHFDRHTGSLAACSQRDVEQARGFFGVVEKKLVKITHPVEQQQARMLRF